MEVLTPLESPNPSLYSFQVILSQKRVSSRKGFNVRIDSAFWPKHLLRDVAP